MNYRKVVEISLDSLRTHKMRSALTMLGIVFGVAAVIGMLSIGEGARRDALEQIEKLGSSNIIVKDDPELRGRRAEDLQRLSEGLTIEDCRNIRTLAPLVKAAVPKRREDIDLVTRGDVESDADVIGTEPDFFRIMSVRLARGRAFDDEDQRSYRRVCVLGYDVARQLFPLEDPIGGKIRLDDQFFTVIGVLSEKYVGRGRIEGLEIEDVNNTVYIPLMTAMKRIDKYARGRLISDRASGGLRSRGRQQPSSIDEISIEVEDSKDIYKGALAAAAILSRRHNNVEDYRIIVPEALLRSSQRTQRIFNIVMGAIAGISLLVGGIGIMNIMLATVLERTKEIGVRRAVGARRRDILHQFLAEALAICLFGCLAGLVFGYALAGVITYYAGWRTIVSVQSMILAVGVSGAVGLGFGIYPAMQAASLNPIDALRYE